MIAEKEVKQHYQNETTTAIDCGSQVCSHIAISWCTFQRLIKPEIKIRDVAHTRGILLLFFSSGFPKDTNIQPRLRLDTLSSASGPWTAVYSLGTGRKTILN